MQFAPLMAQEEQGDELFVRQESFVLDSTIRHYPRWCLGVMVCRPTSEGCKRRAKKNDEQFHWLEEAPGPLLLPVLYRSFTNYP